MRGQAFTIMKMLLGVAFAMAMLIIVYNLPQSKPNIELSVEAIEQTAQYASRAPGKCFERERVKFIKGEAIRESAFTTPLSLETSLPAGAVECDGEVCNIYENIEVPVSAEYDSHTGKAAVNIGERCRQ